MGAFLHLPAFLLACSTPLVPEPNPAAPMREMQIYIQQTGKTTLQGLDLLFFQGGPLESLDAFQHLESVTGGTVLGISSTSARKVAAFSGGAGDEFRWSDIRTFASLENRVFRLEDEDPSAPMMYGVADLPEGMRRSCRIDLQPMLARITLRSIACDFTGHGYAGESLKEVRAYLTYACRECHPFATGLPPSSWINAGRLDETDTGGLPRPGMVLQDISPSLSGRISPHLDFFCYPNPSDGSVFGQPVTRLVIEGKLRGNTYYYPIDLPGLEAGVQYRMDVTLLRAGTTDPDIPAVSGSLILENRVMDWDGRELDDVHYR